MKYVGLRARRVYILLRSCTCGDEGRKIRVSPSVSIFEKRGNNKLPCTARALQQVGEVDNRHLGGGGVSL